MKVIILAGGKGTRLQSVINDVPKPMANINNKPFLQYILDYLSKYNFNKVVFSVGYKKDIIIDYFKDSYKKISLYYSIENTPLGTGGAIKKSLELVDNKDVIILNGDTFCNIDFKNFLETYDRDKDITIVLKEMKNVNRYGSVEIKDNKIISFKEKKHYEKALINAGIYIIKKDIFQKYNLPDNFSFEEFLETNLNNLNTSYYIEENNYFIDIGIPSDYKKAQTDFKELFW